MATDVVQESPSVGNADVIGLQVSLPQLLDLALGTPEVGAVNFNILHNFLQVLLHQTNLRATKVEYRGENAKRIKTMVASLKPGPLIRLQEYNITDGAGKISQRAPEMDGTDVKVLTEAENNLKVTRGVKQQISPGKDTEAETVIFVEPVVNGSTPTALAFKQLEQSVKELQNQFQALKDLSTTPEVMERLKRRMTDPVTDMWQFININKRLEASEQGIDKLTKMLQDMMKDGASVADASPFNERLSELEDKVARLETELRDIRAIVDVVVESTPATADNRVDVKREPEKVPMANEITETDEATVPSREKEETTVKVRKATADVIAAQRANADTADIAEIRRNVTALKTDMTQVQQKLQDLNERVTQIEVSATATVDAASPQPVSTEEKSDNAERPAIAEKPRMNEISDDVKQRLEILEVTHNKAMSNVTERLDKLEKEVGDLLEKVDRAQTTTRVDDINELVAKIQEIQMDMERLGQAANELLDDKESRDAHLNTLLEQIKILKTIKADKEDLENALADKADVQAVNRKVSYDQFGAACDDLASGLVEAVEKLNNQESIWQQALDEVQNEIASKVDKIEMTPLKDLVDTRLKSLQEKLKSLAEMKRESEAAGTKKLLRDVQCISCDKDVVMKTEEIGGLRLESLPCTSSMKPYLTYELDEIRKQQRKLPHSRNMIQFEAAMRETKRMKTVKEEIPTKIPRDHLCNRYCGGSHTVTTPQQRVLRTGHFLTQWGPEVIQLSEGFIKGKDGQMYRGRPMTCKQDTCDSMCWESQISEETRPQERVPSVAAAPRKSFPPRRSSVASPGKRDSRKLSKEPEITEPSVESIEEAQRVISPKESIDYSLIAPTGPQDEIIYETNTATEKRNG